jgi:hypothetical protein
MFGGFGLLEEDEEVHLSSDASSSDEDDDSCVSDVSNSDDEPAATFKWFDDLWELHLDASASSYFWQRAPTINGPSCRAASAYAVHNSSLFIFGGRLANGGAAPRDNSLWSLSYNTDEQKWLWQLMHAGDQDDSATLCPPGRSAAAAVFLEDGAFIVSGGTDNHSKALADVWAFVNGGWHAVSTSISAPSARSAACFAALTKNSLLLAFGSSGLDAATGISAT